MNVSNISRQQKLELVGLSKFDYELSDRLVDLIYEEKIIKNKKELVLSLLNKILIDSNLDQINDISQFKIGIIELKKMDGGKFVDDNIAIFQNLALDMNKDLQYNNRFKRKKYILFVLKVVLKIFDYELESYQSSKKMDDGKTISIIKYRIVNNK